ncbi:hypothetical protein HGH93_06385 [Chitinophaga polysaccharea]|uniref:hypothetical protein n=1 Tax=Chitinophaga TaxID=79328 RepID=UPI0014553694|nr:MULTISPECIES: hypothetical protein [Chitinophaga]NLR57718.1 hypothetical protein [Chitinophaga polysaccharea]NLU93310.1 hypothetical protein [Chitinophaga sp. Ak27]
MKKMVFLLAMASLSSAVGMAQDKSQGKIDYEVTLNVRASMKPDQQQYKDLVPEKVVNKEVLYFNGSKARLSRKDPDEITSDEGAKVKIVTNDGQIAVYSNGATGQSWSLREENGKKTLVSMGKGHKPMGKQVKQVDTAKVETGKRTREILGFTCREMVIKSKEMGEMTLWVTDALPLYAGPMGMVTDKGLVLGVENKKLSAIATAINYSPVSVSEVTIPEDIPVMEEGK